MDIKSNLYAVPTTLVGRYHSYLGMLLTTTDYNRIAPGTPFVCTPKMRLISPPTAGTATQISAEKDIFLSFFWSGHRGSKAYSLWGGVIPSPSIGYDYL